MARSARTELGGLSPAQLEWRPGSGRWGAGDCLVHVCRTNELYLASIDEALASSSSRQRSDIFEPGRLGSWFASRMGPEVRLKVRTLPIFDPLRQPVPPCIVERFLAHQERLLAVLAQARDADLTRTRIASPASRLVRFRLGDALLMLVGHEQRHLQQAFRVLDEKDFPAE